MVKSGDYEIKNIYQGGVSSFKSPSGNYATAGSLGLTTDPRTANILKEVSGKIASGVKHMELAIVSQEIFDAIPIQQLQEVNRLSKLTGVDISMHAPVMDTTGITQQGFSELGRQTAERRVKDILLRSKELNPKGGIPVVFHAAEGIPGTEYIPGKGEDKGKKVENKLIVIDRESGQLAPLERETVYFPGIKQLEKGELRKPREELDSLNHSKWINQLSQVVYHKEGADRIIAENEPLIRHLQEAYKESGQIPIDPIQQEAWGHINNAKTYLDDVQKTLNSMFNKAYTFGTDKQKEELKIIADNYTQEIKNSKDIKSHSRALQTLLNNLREEEIIPKMYVPIEDFAVDKSSQTFGNAVFESYKELKDKAPILNIENPPAGFALSTGEDLARLVEASRAKFVERAKGEGMSESDAKRQAEKLIGATWDVGHINMIRKQGFNEKDVVKETEKIAPYVKHVHLSDNFGFEHTELPMGMGNVPIKEIMKKLGDEGFEGKKIIEAAHWWQHFQSSPFKESAQAMGSPIYSMGASPYWSQSEGLQQGYFGGYGMMLPQTNYETFGGGFSMLPHELGGQRAGAGGSRMSGRPME